MISRNAGVRYVSARKRHNQVQHSCCLSAIFVDASIAHGLLWENDPYWTYWITKTFLITTVFLFGTAFLGIGIVPGLVLTAVHTLILEVYYQWLAPVGLPQEPEWLDFNHLWITGVPVHFLAIFGGYLMALWLWRRNHPVLEAERGETWRFVVYGLVTALIIVALDRILTQLVLLRDFPGITFFVQHLLITFVFVCVWTAYAGAGPVGWGVGALMLALVWTTYSMYLGPRGLPFDQPYYSGYRDLWWLSFPGGFVSALIGWWIGVWLMNKRRMIGVAGIAMLVGLLGVPADPASAQTRGTDGLVATARASGEGLRVTGADPFAMNSTVPMNGTIAIETVEMGNRWSHVQNTDDAGLGRIQRRRSQVYCQDRQADAEAPARKLYDLVRRSVRARDARQHRHRHRETAEGPARNRPLGVGRGQPQRRSHCTSSSCPHHGDDGRSDPGGYARNRHGRQRPDR
ncbi:MFS transporter [Mesorhizobium sp. M1312]|uniref:hypothetical protein n=1 Tax=unclassified Mesorhizobium TaxID=325217 RepID=UPI00333913B3